MTGFGSRFDMRKYIPALFTVLIIVAMVGTSELMHEKEVIFPEIAAIAVGAMLAPKFTWNTSKLRIFIFIMLAAAIGMLIVFIGPGPLWLQLIIAFSISQLLLAYSGTSFAPMASAVVLPVMLQTRTPIYLLSAFIFTVGILLLRIVLERLNIREPVTYNRLGKPEGKEEWLFILKKIAASSAMIIAAVLLGWPFAVAPPILVAFTEFAEKSSKARRKPVKVVVLISVCAAVGAMSRYLFTMTLGLPLTLAALIAAVVVIAIIYGFGMFVPPAGAMGILAMLVPEDVVLFYPVMSLVGTGIFMVLAKAFFKKKKKAD